MKDVQATAEGRATLSGFLKALRSSGLLDEKTLEKSVAQFKAESTGKSDPATTGGQFGRYLVAQNLLTDWQCRKLLEGKLRSFFLGKYKLLRPIGAGGMSHVYLAEHTRMHRQVAIKILSGKLTKQPGYLQRFLIEARAIAALDHPNIVHAYSVDSDETRHYLVMQYIEGSDLERTIEVHGALPCERAADYICQAADGLAHAHERGLIHRDVKPGNLLVDRTGVVKILDLGLALRVEASNSITQAAGDGVMLGTTDFLAPEQALDSHNVDARTDVYSLGCTLYYLLAGHAPFPEGTMAERLVKHQAVEPTKLNRLRNDVPADLAGICAKMMAKKPGERYQTAHEVSAVLRNWLANRSRSPSEFGSSFCVPQLGTASHFGPQAGLPGDEDEVSSTTSGGSSPTIAPEIHSFIARRPGLSIPAIGGLAVAAVMLLALVGWGAISAMKPRAAPTSAWVVLDWPATERAGAKLTLDGKVVAIPVNGSIEIPTHAGSRHVVLTRPGFPPYERTVALEAGQRRSLAPWWGGTGDTPALVAAVPVPAVPVAVPRPVAPPITSTVPAGTAIPTKPAVPPVAQAPIAQAPAPPLAIDPVFQPRPRTHSVARAQSLTPLAGGGVVSNIKVLSDKVPDVSSLEAWRRAYIADGASDREKALAIWRSVCQFEHFDHPPVEYTHHEAQVHDPIKLFNVYGYSVPAMSASSVAALARAEGLAARGRIAGQALTEVEYDGAWHALDPGSIAVYPKADGQLASVEELNTAIPAWFAANPGYLGNDERLREFMRAGGWRKGPDILVRSPAFDQNGWMPAANFGWNSIMQRYDGREVAHYEHGYTLGYQVNVQLRPGERLVRNWSNRGLHVGMKDQGRPGCLDQRVGEGALRYSPAMGDLAPGRIGNGRHEYQVGLGTKSLRHVALFSENLSTRDERESGPALAAANPAEPGTLVMRMPSSYVYLTGQVELSAVIGMGGSISVSFSDNHGLDWKPVAMLSKSDDHTLDLSPLVFRRYDYQLKFVLAGEGTGLDRLEFAHDVQHSQRPLPALAKGPNRITFSAGAAEGTITQEASTILEHRTKQLVYPDFHPVLKNVAPPHLHVPWGEGSVTFAVDTPGDLIRLRFGTHYRARDARDGWDYEVSYDDGQTFRKVDRAAGPTVGNCHYIETGDVPSGVKRALVRFAGVTRNTTMILNFRIDADYREPHGGFQPVKVTYAWEEQGQAKSHVHLAQSAEDAWQIDCAETPVMKSLTVELAE